MPKPILFIHPDPKLIRLYEPHLQRYFAFDSAYDGLSGLRKIRLIKPGLVVSEVDLPKLSGLSLLKFVRSNPSYIHIPFLFLTKNQDPTQALNFGANDWLPRKSTSPSQLIDKIYYHLQQSYAI